jgi:hypothetical protein
MSPFMARLSMVAGVAVLGVTLAWASRAAMPYLLRRSPVEGQLLAGRLAYIAVLAGTVLWSLSVVGVHTAAIAALAGSTGLSVGLPCNGWLRTWWPGSSC